MAGLFGLDYVPQLIELLIISYLEYDPEIHNAYESAIFFNSHYYGLRKPTPMFESQIWFCRAQFGRCPSTVVTAHRWFFTKFGENLSGLMSTSFNACLGNIFSTEIAVTGHARCNEGFRKLIQLDDDVCITDLNYISEHYASIWKPEIDYLLMKPSRTIIYDGIGIVISRMLFGLLNNHLITIQTKFDIAQHIQSLTRRKHLQPVLLDAHTVFNDIATLLLTTDIPPQHTTNSESLYYELRKAGRVIMQQLPKVTGSLQ